MEEHKRNMKKYDEISKEEDMIIRIRKLKCNNKKLLQKGLS
jgi:hypothetical protein